MSYLREEYQKLQENIEKCKKGEGLNLQEMLSQNRRLFSSLQNALTSGSPDEKKEAFAIFNEVISLLAQEGKMLAQKAHLSEADILSLAQKPGVLSPEQEKLLHEAKEELQKTGQNLANILKK